MKPDRKGTPQRRNLADDARHFRLMQNLQALLVVLPVVAGLMAVIWYAFSGSNKPDKQLTNWNHTPAFSAVHTPKELLDVVKGSRTAFREYIKRDRVDKKLDHVEKLFSNVRSEADLSFAVRELVRASGDEYAEVLTTNEYDDRMARMQGKSIGADIEFENRWPSKNFYVSRCWPESDAYAQGIREGDELISIDERHIAQINQGNPWQTVQLIRRILDTGILGSTVKVVCKHDDGTVVDAVIRRVVTGQERQATFNASDAWGVEGGKQVTVQNLWNPDTVTGLEETLRQFETDKVRGVLLDLQQVTGSEGDAAIRVAALFLENAVIAHRIDVNDKGELFMRTWEAKYGKVYLRTRGPIPVNPDGNIDPNAKPDEKEETLDWPSNVFTGQVIVLMGAETSGGGEVIAAAMMQNEKKHVVTSMYLTAGKGSYQSYYDVGQDYVVALTTAYYLQPNGKSIEGERLRPTTLPPGNVDMTQWAMYLLEQRVRVIPAPILPPQPGDPQPDPPASLSKPKPKSDKDKQ